MSTGHSSIRPAKLISFVFNTLVSARGANAVLQAHDLTDLTPSIIFATDVSIGWPEGICKDPLFERRPLICRRTRARKGWARSTRKR